MSWCNLTLSLFCTSWCNLTLSSGGGNRASCYNGLQLASQDVEGGRVIHLACTYTAMWSATIGPSYSRTPCGESLLQR